MKPTADTPQTTQSDKIRAIVLRPTLSGAESARESEPRLEEARGLAEALDLEVAHAEVVALREISPRTYIGSGRV